MSNLSAFLSQNAIQEDNVKFAASKRFIDAEGKPVEWEITAVTSVDDEAIRKQYTKKVAVPGKRGQYTQDFDANGYLGSLGTKCTVFPNLNSQELQDSYGVMGAEALLKVMLKPGEYQEYMKKIQEVNGFDVGMDDLVDEAKN
ncbi:phage tail assembly chaperone [Paenibacillus sp. FA6]|uniref:phage tail assembly chaperone n=1 Tax=Paenibacillus sp. FA6 TaxID=3413029 RepID=UPI003F65EF29